MLQSWAPFTSSQTSRTAAPTYATAASSLRRRYVPSFFFLFALPPSLSLAYVHLLCLRQERLQLKSLPFTRSRSPSIPPSLNSSFPPSQVRGQGVGTIMALSFLRLARDLGYKASYCNLVFGR